MANLTPEELEVIANIPTQTLQDVLDSIRDGAASPAESFGFNDAALRGIENMAHAYYKAKKYPYAAVIYGFVLRMNGNRGVAWRGLGACAHALKDYVKAAYAYRMAMDIDPEDIPSKVFLGECLCQVGETEPGVALLEEVIRIGTPLAAYKPYIARARAIVSAGGGRPATIVLKREGKRLVEETQKNLVELPSEVFEQALNGRGPESQDSEVSWATMQRNPKLRSAIKDLSKAVAEGRLTYSQIGGFTEDEMNGAYAVACRYCDMGEVLKSVQIAGYLIFLNPQEGSYYQLVGICLQRLKQYEAADFYYRMAMVLVPNDPMTHVYRGECRILSGRIDAGLTLVRKGMQLAKNVSEFKSLIERGQILVKQFSA
ncbi:MAG: tetratricopeptide repeat protein [Clostridia bacterium]|nr:tetratricopeptide repeat protein [Deltaproteobacteria bacterium]